MINFLLEGEAATPAATNGSWLTIVMLVALVAVFYFVTIRPQRKQEKETQEMRNSLQVGDEVTTIGGIIGKIISIKDETVMIETGKDKTRIRFLKSAIRSVDVKAEDTIEAQQKAESKDSTDNKDNKN